LFAALQVLGYYDYDPDPVLARGTCSPRAFISGASGVQISIDVKITHKH